MYDIKLVTVISKNKMSERTIQTIIYLLVKCSQNGEVPFLAILNYNATPKQPAPSELLVGRKLNTDLLATRGLLKRKYPIFTANEKMKEMVSPQKTTKN